MALRRFALIFGIVYLLIGVLSLIPGLLTPPPAGVSVTVNTLEGMLFGIFHVNILHTVVHLLIGLWGVLASRDWSASRTYARATAIIFGVLFILGLIPATNTLFGLVPLHSANIWLHLVSSLVAAYFGWLVPVTETEPTRMGTV